MPEICGEQHIQHVNSMHRHLRLFLAKYYGVSTKYLENYVALYTWLKNISINSKQKKHIEKITVGRVAVSDCYITRDEIEARPALPMCS